MHPLEALKYLNGEEKIPNLQKDRLLHAKDVFYRISLHISGKRPKYTLYNKWHTPPMYDEAYQNIFVNRLLIRHPRESELTLQWRLANYRELTKAPFNQVINIISSAIFQDSNYTLDIKDEEDKDFIWGNNYHGYNLISYMANIGIKNMIEDPNGYFVRMPRYPFYEQPEGKIPIDVCFVYSKDIIYPPDGDTFIFKKDGYAYSIDRQSIWRYTLGRDKKYFLEGEDTQGYYTHGFGKLPISIAGGDWNTAGYYDSYLGNAQAAADEFVSAYSAKQLVDRDSSYTIIQEAATDCPQCNSKGQIQRTCETCTGGWELVTCGMCAGSGVVSRNPGERIIVPKEDMANDAIKFHSPDVGVNGNLREDVKMVMTFIIDALNLSVVDEAQSGVAKAIDQDRLYQLVNKVSNRAFDIIDDTVKESSAYRNVQTVGGDLQPAYAEYVLIKPTQFAIKTAAMLLDEFDKASKANMPSFVMTAQIREYVDKQFPGNELLQKKTAFILVLDTLATDSIEDISTLNTFGAVSKEEILYHRMLPKMVDDLIEEQGAEWFLDADLETLKERLKMPQPTNTTITDNMPLIPPVQPPTAIPATNT